MHNIDLPQEIINSFSVFNTYELSSLKERYVNGIVKGIQLIDEFGREINLENNLLKQNALKTIEKFYLKTIAEQTLLQDSISQIKENKLMLTKQLNFNGATITVEANTMNELVAVLEKLGYSSEIYNEYYYSRSEKNRGNGDGWLLIDDMPNEFIVNAIVARLGESLRWIFNNVDNEGQTLYLTYVNNLLFELTTAQFLNNNPASLVVKNNNIILGLLNKLSERIGETNNYDFDDDEDDTNYYDDDDM